MKTKRREKAKRKDRKINTLLNVCKDYKDYKDYKVRRQMWLTLEAKSLLMIENNLVIAN